MLAEKLHENEVRVSVTDTGRGIKEKDQDRLFKLFAGQNAGEEINTRGIGFGFLVSKLIV